MGAGGQTGLWSVGELAGASGMTVRALHYYDEIGLVPPSERTSAGHRRYTDADVRRLYRVRALLQLGLSLESVGTVLDGAADDPAALRDLLVAQLADLDARAERLDASRRRVRSLLDRYASDPPGAEQLLSALELTVPIVDASSYVSPAHLDALARHGERIGADAVATLRQRWMDLLREGRDLVRAGVPTTDPSARALAERWRTVGTALRGDTAGDVGLDAAVAALWTDRARAIDRGMAERVSWLDAGDVEAVVAYVRAAEAS